MILSDRDILEEMEKGTLVIKDFARECLGPASYDMRLRKHVFRSSTGKRPRRAKRKWVEPVCVGGAMYTALLSHIHKMD